MVGVVILNFNSLAETRACVEELLSTGASGESILVFDNGSSTNEALSLQTEFDSRVIVVRSTANLGFAGGCNFAADILLRRVRTDSLMFLNSDCRISWPEVTKLEDYLDSQRRAAAVGPSILYPDGSPQSAGGKVDFVRGEPSWYTTGISDQPYEVQVLHGSAILIRKEAWDSVGPFDIDYFAYSEETDWCARAARQGWKLFCIPQCTAYHGVRGSSGGEMTPLHAYLWARNRILFMRKRGERRHFPLFFMYLLVYTGRHVLHHMIRGELEKSKASMRGVRDGLGWWFLSSPLSEFSDRLGTADPSSVEELT